MSERDLFIKWADAAGLDLHPGRFCEFLLADTAAAYRAWQARADLAAQSRAEIEAGALERWVNGKERNTRTTYMGGGYVNAMADVLDEAARIRSEAES